MDLYFATSWDTTNLPDHSITEGVTHVSTAFAASTIFNSGTWYQPFMPLDQIRALFDDGVQICLSIGGWGDTIGFSAGAKSNETRQTYAQNVATAVKTLGYDCVGEYNRR
jgi:chitinase